MRLTRAAVWLLARHLLLQMSDRATRCRGVLLLGGQGSRSHNIFVVAMLPGGEAQPRQAATKQPPRAVYGIQRVAVHHLSITFRERARAGGRALEHLREGQFSTFENKSLFNPR